MATKRKGKDLGKKASSASAKTDVQAKTMKQIEEPATEAKPPKSGSPSQSQSESKKNAGVLPKNIETSAKPKGKKEDKKDGERANFIAHFAQFLKEVNVESRKITWPERALVLRETWGVIVLVAVLTFLVLGFDWAIGHFVFQPLEHWARILGGGVGH